MLNHIFKVPSRYTISKYDYWNLVLKLWLLNQALFQPVKTRSITWQKRVNTLNLLIKLLTESKTNQEINFCARRSIALIFRPSLKRSKSNLGQLTICLEYYALHTLRSDDLTRCFSTADKTYISVINICLEITGIWFPGSCGK